MDLLSFLRKRRITINIESDSIRGLVLRGGRVEKWGRVALAPDLVKDELILQPKAVGLAVRELLTSLKSPKGKVTVSLSGLRSVYRFLTLPRMGRDLVEESIRRATKSEIPVPLEQLYLSWRPVGSKGDEQEFFVLGVPRDLVDAQFQSLAEGGVRPDIMRLKPLVLAGLVNLRDALIVDLEPGSSSIVLVVNGVPAIMRTTTPREGGAALEDNIRRVTEDILRTIEFYNQGHPESPLSPTTPAFLTGELANDPAVTGLVRNGIDNPVLPLEPPVKCPPEMPITSYAVNIGLTLAKAPVASRGERPRDVSLNVLPAKYQPRGWPLKIIFFSLAVVIAMGGLLPANQMKVKNDAETTRLTVELADISGELQRIRLTMNQEKALREDISRAEAAVKTIEVEHQTILAQRGEFGDTLDIITRLLPDSVRLDSISLTSGQILLEGNTDSPDDAVRYAKALEREGSYSLVSITMLSQTAFSITISR